jgi:hypothetical protein
MATLAAVRTKPATMITEAKVFNVFSYRSA